MKKTAEYVSAWHPDKVCDQISDAILDACLSQDPMSRVAIETMGGHGTINLTGELTTKADISPIKIARAVYSGLYPQMKEPTIISNIAKQSPDISQGVDTGGAGDQGIMIGYACNESPENMPIEMSLAKQILLPFETDAKSQVTTGWIKGQKYGITDLVLSVAGKTQKELEKYLATLDIAADAFWYCNNTGAFEIAGFDADAGVTGRKIVIDQYGPNIPVGGGAFSGKDPTKVDRSGAYMARYIALDLLKKRGVGSVLVKLAYVIGRDSPLMATALFDNLQEVGINYADYDCRPQAIIERFDLRRPIYQQTARDGHFGIKSYPWEQV
jgi:S-adenosylmethionine synthetase